MQKIRSASIILVLISCISYAIPIWAKPAAIASNPTDRWGEQFQAPPLPDNGAPTGRPRGAAGRGNNCALEQPPLTALVPATEQPLGKEQGKVTYVWGKTVAEYPTFWFYVPYSRASLRSLEFVLQADDNDIYRTPVKLPEIPGVVSLQLPSTLMPLKIGKLYHWFFKTKVDCDAQKSSGVEDYVEGWVQRVSLSPTLARQLEVATPQQRLTIYAANGIWYEAVTTLGELRLDAPKDATLNAHWAELLQSAGLGDIASKPLSRK